MKTHKKLLIQMLLVAALSLTRTAAEWHDFSRPNLTPNALIVAPTGALFAAGRTSTGAAISRYDDTTAAWSFVVAPLTTGGYFGMCATGSAMFAAGFANGWIVQRSPDWGQTWETSEQFSFGNNLSSEAWAVAVDPVGNLFAIGSAQTRKQGSSQWLVRKSSNWGDSWQSVDLPTDGGAYYNCARAVAILPEGIFVTGHFTSKGNMIWTVRKSSDGGVTWSTVDSFPGNGGHSAASGIVRHPATATIYVGGRVFLPVSKNSSDYFWGVRKSSDGGATWQMSDQFRYKSTSTMVAGSGGPMTIDPAGNIFVCGSGGSRWLTRVLRTGSTQWELSDDTEGQGFSVTTDQYGAILTAGSNSNGPLVRFLAQ